VIVKDVREGVVQQLNSSKVQRKTGKPLLVKDTGGQVIAK